MHSRHAQGSQHPKNSLAKSPKKFLQFLNIRNVKKACLRGFRPCWRLKMTTKYWFCETMYKFYFCRKFCIFHFAHFNKLLHILPMHLALSNIRRKSWWLMTAQYLIMFSHRAYLFSLFLYSTYVKQLTREIFAVSMWSMYNLWIIYYKSIRPEDCTNYSRS